MAQKKDEKKDMLHEIMLEKGPSFFLKVIKGFIDELSKSMSETIHRYEKKYLDTLMSYLFFSVGIIFIATAVIFLINEYLGLSRGWSFLFIGLIMVLWSVFIKGKAYKTD